ncbi:UDP-N-acetyl glucosamine 2-epimerase [Akkermansiaceae bacterium]|jgi:UDP-N-acetylglucosamine 2-epimerase (non-hydrolysing)|nr:UDP-N-acetyl glucosamine 2-epimerase [Akkermansiaceae bacterium]
METMIMSRFLHIVGTRPNFIKAWPVIVELNKLGYTNEVLNTGQHYDKNMTDDILNDIGMDTPHYNITRGSVAEMINGITPIMKYNYDAIFIYGDVDSSLAGVIAAHSAKIDIIHVESGLRSGDLQMPEEVNRRVIDILSKWKFTTEVDGMHNLIQEGLSDGVMLVGNTAIDTLKKLSLKKVTTDSKSKRVLLTLHRPFNVDNCANLTEILMEVDSLGLDVTFPVHPRTRENIIGHYNNITLVEPMGYKKFMSTLINSDFVISDSGGVQCECASLNVPLFILRPSTEHKSVLKHNKAKLINVGDITLEKLNDFIETEYNDDSVSTLWDGKASERLAFEISKIYE